MRIVAPFGFYGWGNIGDEATLNGFARLLALTGASAQVWIGSRNPAHTARAEPAFRYFDVSRRDPRRWWAKLRGSVHAVVGGTPIQDVLGDWPLRDVTPLVRSIDRRKVPFVFIGVGIEDLRLDESRRLVVTEIVPRVRQWSVRCDRDRQRLEELGVAPEAITVAADMAWLIEPVTADFGRARLGSLGIDLDRPLIGVNLVNENYCLDQNPGMVDGLAKALDTLVEVSGARVIFLANEVRDGASFDKAAATKVFGQMRSTKRAVVVPSEYLVPREMMSIVACCAMTISMRYHFCMFSALQQVPFIAIERSTKLSDLCSDLDWPARVVPPELESSAIVSHANRLIGGESVADRRLLSSESLERLKARALLNVAALTVRGAREATQLPPHLSVPGGP
jgi:polysaccharide pyruvyl transferase WcaK-like protein